MNYPFIKIIKGKIAFLNYTYGTNGLEVKLPNIVNKIDTLQISKDLIKAKELSADFIIVTLHWGAEYERIYNSTQKILLNGYVIMELMQLSGCIHMLSKAWRLCIQSTIN